MELCQSSDQHNEIGEYFMYLELYLRDKSGKIERVLLEMTKHELADFIDKLHDIE